MSQFTLVTRTPHVSGGLVFLKLNLTKSCWSVWLVSSLGEKSFGLLPRK